MDELGDTCNWGVLARRPTSSDCPQINTGAKQISDTSHAAGHRETLFSTLMLHILVPEDQIAMLSVSQVDHVFPAPSGPTPDAWFPQPRGTRLAALLGQALFESRGFKLVDGSSAWPLGKVLVSLVFIFALQPDVGNLTRRRLQPTRESHIHFAEWWTILVATCC